MIKTDSQQAIEWSFADLTPAKTQYLTHGYHRYPAKFIPQLVAKLIEEYSLPKSSICDPFGGCGTTLVEAKLANRVSFGFDINPVAVMITRAKIQAINPVRLSKIYKRLSQYLDNEQDNAPITRNNRLDISRLSYWFGESNLKQLLALKLYLEKQEEPDIRRFFLCALSHILKNCSYWLTTSTKPQKDLNKTPELPAKAFKKHASRMLDRNGHFYEAIQKLSPKEPIAVMRQADARNLPLPDKCIDLIITSPPYSTSYEYSDIHQLTALLFGYCAKLGEFRSGFIGSKNGNHRNGPLNNRKAIKAIKALRLVDISLSGAVQSYFLDMDNVYENMQRVLKKDGRACIVIGNTELRGIPIPNAEIAVEEMGKEGFRLEKAIERPVPGRVLTPFRDKYNGRFTSPDNPNAKKVYSHEYILVLRKK